jgi:hypothetical protein
MQDEIKLIGKYDNVQIKFSINPHITMDEMIEKMELFLKSVGFQFDSLEWNPLEEKIVDFPQTNVNMDM